MPPGTPQAVADLSGSLEVVAGPAAGMVGQGSLIVGGLLLAAVGSLARAVVLRGRTGATKVQYTPCGKQLASISGDEGRSVVALEHQGRAVFPEERGEDGDRGFGGRVGDGLPGKLVVGGQVADRKDIGIEPVDGLVGLNVVHRPDGSRMVPTQSVDEPLVLVSPDPSKAAQDVLQFTARHG